MPTTGAMKDIIVKIMVEVLGIFAIVTKEVKRGRTSESIPDDMLPIADRNSEKYLRKLIGRRDIEDALSRLDRLTQDEAQMATAQLLKVAHRVEDGVEIVDDKVQGVDDRVQVVDDKVQGVDDKIRGVDDKVKDIDDKVNVAIEGTFSMLVTHKSS